jgi:hypothetical protein
VLVSEGNGRFRARANGTALVSAGVDGDASVPRTTARVEVRQQVARLELPADTVNLFAIGQTDTLRALTFDALGAAMVVAPVLTWRSPNTAIATVNSSGVITAAGDGEISLTVESGAITSSVVLRVAATIRITGCVSSAELVDGATCSDLQISVNAGR